MREKLLLGYMWYIFRETVMPAMELTEVVAWALINGGFAFAAIERRGGLPAAAVTATLAALATKTALLG